MSPPNNSNVVNLLNDNADELFYNDNDDDLDDSILIGSGEYTIVGIRYYTGIAHPGEYIQLVREPNNPYDRNAIRVDNMQNEKIGHIKATMARGLSSIMDGNINVGGGDGGRVRVRIEGTIPRKGNFYTLPVFLEFYASADTAASNTEQAQQIAMAVKETLKYDYHFRLSTQFGGDGMSLYQMNNRYNNRIPPAAIGAAEAAPPTVTTKKLDWTAQQEALDKMFDKQLEEQYKDLPDVDMELLTNNCLRNITLFEYQVLGIKWLVKKEQLQVPTSTSTTAADASALVPFYRKVNENGREMYLCEITQSSQALPPKVNRGSILCDSMGLGKSIQTIGLILLAPPMGVDYLNRSISASVVKDEENEKEETGLDTAVTTTGATGDDASMPTDSDIRCASMTTLKSVLKAAKLKVSGKKEDLVQRIIDAKSNDVITSEHFPISMRESKCNLQMKSAALTSSSATTPTSTTTSRCTMIVCPVSVMSNWIHQVENHVQNNILSLEMYHGANRNETGILDKIKACKVDVLLVSYHTLAAEYGAAFGSSGDNDGDEKPKKKRVKRETIFDIGFHRIVLDEAVCSIQLYMHL